MIEKTVVDGEFASLTQRTQATELEQFIAQRFVPSVALPTIVKVLAVISANFKIHKPLWVLGVSPSRQLKSATSDFMSEIFPKSKLVKLHSDFTILYLVNNYKNGAGLMHKCLLINDLTLLLASKSERARERLINGMAELASEGIYEYGDFQTKAILQFRGSLIGNITTSSYMHNRQMLFQNTFTNRCLRVFHEIPLDEQSEANIHRESKNKLRFPRLKIAVRESQVQIADSDIKRFNDLSIKWAEIGTYTSTGPIYDMIISLAVAYSMLAGYTKITQDTYNFLQRLEKNLACPYEKQQIRILQLAKIGYKVGDICAEIYPHADPETKRGYVYGIVKRFREAGVLPAEAT